MKAGWPREKSPVNPLEKLRLIASMA